jgi:hypothetical protein
LRGRKEFAAHAIEDGGEMVTNSRVRAGAVVVLAFGCVAAGAPMQPSVNRWPAARPGFFKVGHDNIVVDPTVRRYSGMVVAAGSPDGEGKTYSFKTMPLGPRSFALTGDDLRGWRLTVLAGKRFGEVFTVRTNTESVITVTADKGPIDGMAAHDVFIVESIDANGVSMFAPAGAASAASAGV